jgi:hypothetical protein
MVARRKSARALPNLLELQESFELVAEASDISRSSAWPIALSWSHALDKKLVR